MLFHKKKMKEINLSISNNSTMVFRVGFANIIIPMGLLFSYVTYEISNRYVQYSYLGLIIAACVFFLFLAVYSRSISELKIRGNQLFVTTAIKHNRFSVNKIQKYDVYLLLGSATLFITLSIQGKRFPAIYFFISPTTSLGSIRETEQKLKDIFSEGTTENGEEVKSHIIAK